MPHRDVGGLDQQGGVVTSGNNGSIVQPNIVTPPPVPRKQKRLANQVRFRTGVYTSFI